MDRFTMQMFDFFQAHVEPDSSATLGQLLSSFRWVQWGLCLGTMMDLESLLVVSASHS